MTLAKSAALQVYSEDSQSGLDLPDGWTFAKIGEILAINYGKGLKKAKRMPGPVSVYGSNGVVGKHNIPLTHGPTIILGRKGTVGAVHFSKVPCWPIDTTYFIDKFNGLAPRYLVCALRRLNLSRLDTSTAIPGLNRDDLYCQYIPLAPPRRAKADRGQGRTTARAGQRGAGASGQRVEDPQALPPVRPRRCLLSKVNC